MSNTSATGGYLSPVYPEITGLELRRTIGEILVGISGLEATLVRPAYQENPPPSPSINVNWLAFFIQERRGDANSYQKEVIPNFFEWERKQKNGWDKDVCN